MRQRNPFAVLLLPFVTFGIYSWYWFVSTKNEMNKLGEQIPTAWIWLIPVIGPLWWYWKYSEGVEHVTKGKISGVIAFILLLIFGIIAHAIIQDSFNKSTTPIASAALDVPVASSSTKSSSPIATTPPPVSAS